MSAKDNYTQDEWRRVLSGPGQAGLAVIAASPSGLTGLLAEAGAIAGVLRDLIAAQPKTPLLDAMADTFQHATPQEVRAGQTPNRADRPRNLQETRERALTDLRQALWLVRTKSTPEDVRAYETLVQNVAERVAGAAKEGGFLGIGGVQVSDAERAALEEIRQLLSYVLSRAAVPDQNGGARPV